MIRVVVVDDHGIIRDGLRAALGTRADLAVVGEAATGNEAVAVVEDTVPDVVLMDLNLPDIDGETATRRIVEAGSPARVLVLTMSTDDDALLRALRAGAKGYLLKDAGRDEIEWAIRTVASGGMVVGGRAADQLLATVTGSAASSLAPFPQLTDRERELLELLAQGRSNEAMARALFLSQKTVRNRMSAIIAKPGVNDRTAAIIAARDAGFGRA